MLSYCRTNNANRSRVSLRNTFSNCHFLFGYCIVLYTHRCSIIIIIIIITTAYAGCCWRHQGGSWWRSRRRRPPPHQTGCARCILTRSGNGWRMSWSVSCECISWVCSPCPPSAAAILTTITSHHRPILTEEEILACRLTFNKASKFADAPAELVQLGVGMLLSFDLELLTFNQLNSQVSAAANRPARRGVSRPPYYTQM